MYISNNFFILYERITSNYYNITSNIFQILLDWVELKSEKLGGEGVIVEIDESKFGKRKYNRGHRVEGQWIVGGFERGTGRLFLVAVEDRTKETMEEVIKTWVKPGTTIHTDFFFD